MKLIIIDYISNYILKILNYILKILNYILKILNYILKISHCIFKISNYIIFFIKLCYLIIFLSILLTLISFNYVFATTILNSDFSLNEKESIGKLKIKGVVPNTKGRDYNEKIILENIGKNNLNLKGLIIDDIIGKGSKKFVIKNDKIIKSGEEIIFLKPETKISLGNKKDEVNIIYNNKLIDKISWDFSVPVDYIITHNTSKITRKKVYVVKVIDGDTIIVRFKDKKEEKVRFIGINAPEITHFKGKGKGEYFGKESAKFVKDKLEGKNIILEQNIENYRGIYDRLLGYIYELPSKLTNISINGEEINNLELFNKILVEKGYAKAYLRYKFKYSSNFKKAEEKAKQNNLGMWRKIITKKINKSSSKNNKKGEIKSNLEIKKVKQNFVEKNKQNIIFGKNKSNLDKNKAFLILKKQETVVNFFRLNILLGVVIFLMGFLVLKKHKLI